MGYKYIVILSMAILITSCTHLKMSAFMFRENLTENDKQTIVRGRQAYLLHCVQCHGLNADGLGPLAETLAAAPTDFTNSNFKKSTVRIAANIAYGKRSFMPAFLGTLSEESIWDISNYLHSLQE